MCEGWMKEDKERETYPLRTLHDFLLDLEREWDKFRTGSLVGIILSALLLFFIVRMLNLRLLFRPRTFLDTLFLLFIIFLLLYSIYMFYEQHKFFRRWEKRVGLLIHLEEKLMEEAIERED